MKNKYLEYKSSGVDWIGEIPSNWSISKFKYISNLFNGDSLNDEQKIKFESENMEDIPYVSSKDIEVVFSTVNYNNGLRIPTSETKFKIGRKGGFLLCIEGGSSGKKMVFLEQDVCFVNKLCYFYSKNNNTKFLYYFVKSSNFKFQFQLSMTGLIGGVSISTLKNFNLPLPPIEQQNHIVKYLDEKIFEIDKLISITKRKIELLNEKKVSIINTVLTKGIESNIELKDSGIIWISDGVPKHWERRRVSTLGLFSKGSGITKDEVKEMGFPCIRYGEIYTVYDRVVYSTFSFIDEHTTKNSVTIEKGNVLFTGSGETIEDIGKSVVYYGEEDIYVGGDIIILKLFKDINPLFISYLMNCNYISHQKTIFGKGEIIIHIYSKGLREIITFLPPLSEQNELVKYLDKHVKEIDELVELEKRRIDLLKEYKQSLISEVVTGKLNILNN